MLLSGVLFILFLAGCWLYCLTDAALTPAVAALARHPASQAKRAADPARAVPLGPDDDPEFLRQLSDRIRRDR